MRQRNLAKQGYLQQQNTTFWILYLQKISGKSQRRRHPYCSKDKFVQIIKEFLPNSQALPEQLEIVSAELTTVFNKKYPFLLMLSSPRCKLKLNGKF